MKRHDTMPLSLDDVDSQTLGALLQQSPSAAGPRGQAAVQMIAKMADGILLDARYVRRTLTIDRGQIFIDWAMLAQLGRSLLADRHHTGPSSPAHPDAGMALVLAASIATAQLTDSGIDTLRLALTTTGR